VLDALLDQSPTAKPASDPMLTARSFITSLDQTHEEVFPSVGYGQDHRYNAPTLTGSMLVHADYPIHSAFLTFEESAPGSPSAHLSSLRHRRHFRSR
jgi:hypothetical protein